MNEEFVPRLNGHGLFLHEGARRTIDVFRREAQVGNYPMYLVGLALPEHRNGPALAALLTLPDGGVINAHARSLGKKQKVNDVLQSDVDFLDADGLQRFRSVFYQMYGGFGSACPESSPNAAAESMLTNAWLGLRFGPEVGPSPQGPPKRFPSDWTDVVYYSQKAVGCTVEGFAPSADAIAGLDVPDALKRAMQLAESNELAWLNALEGRITSEIHVQIPALVTEAWAVRFLSPRASVVLLRSAAELVAENLGAGGRANFNKKLEGLEARWDAEAPDRLPAGRRETVWRAGILSCFHTVREIGNRIHSDSVVAPSEVALAHNSIQRLVEAVLRTGPLDKAGPT